MLRPSRAELLRTHGRGSRSIKIYNGFVGSRRLLCIFHLRSVAECFLELAELTGQQIRTRSNWYSFNRTG